MYSEDCAIEFHDQIKSKMGRKARFGTAGGFEMNGTINAVTKNRVQIIDEDDRMVHIAMSSLEHFTVTD